MQVWRREVLQPAAGAPQREGASSPPAGRQPPVLQGNRAARGPGPQTPQQAATRYLRPDLPGEGDLSRFFPQFVQIFPLEALDPIFGYEDAGF